MENKKVNVKIIAIALVIVALAAIVGAAFFLLRAGDSNDANGVVINDDVVVYEEGQSPFEIIRSDGESVTVSSTEGLSEGAILAAGVTDATPNGLLRRLGAVEESSSGYKFATTQAALTEAIDKCDVSYEISITENGEYEVKDRRTGAVSPLVQQAFADEGLDNLFSWEEGPASVHAGDVIEASLKIDHGTIEMRVVNHFNAGSDLDLGRLVSANGEPKSWTLFSKGLRPFTFTVGIVPVVFTNRISVDLTVEGGVNVKSLVAEATIDKSFGFEYTSAGGLKPVNEDNSVAPELSFMQEDYAPSITAEVDAELDAHFTSLLYGCAGPDFSVGLESTTQAKLQKLIDGEDANGAIHVPGLDWNLKGTLGEKVVVPIRGTFHAETPFNIFDGGDIDIEVFTTGDSITLVHIEKEFGEFGRASTTANDSPGSYKTKFQEVNMVTYPYFTFAVPLGWSVSSDEVSGDGETVTVDSVLGASIKYSHLPLNIGGAQLGRTMMRAEFERVADSSFVPTGVQGTDHSHLGEFMVAHVTITGILDMNTDADYRNGNFGEYYAVVPASMEGTQEYLQGTPEVFLSFDYSAKISFFCAVPDGGLAPTDQASAIEILSSFKIGD